VRPEAVERPGSQPPATKAKMSSDDSRELMSDVAGLCEAGGC
jgi:hypothetical protein